MADTPVNCENTETPPETLSIDTLNDRDTICGVHGSPERNILELRGNPVRRKPMPELPRNCKRRAEVHVYVTGIARFWEDRTDAETHEPGDLPRYQITSLGGVSLWVAWQLRHLPSVFLRAPPLGSYPQQSGS
jgi:hypothetical protein